MVVVVLQLFQILLYLRINQRLIPYERHLLVVRALIFESTFLLHLRDTLLNVFNRKELLPGRLCAKVIKVQMARRVPSFALVFWL